MIECSQLIDAIYSNRPLNVKSKYIIDPEKISSERMFKMFTRYRTSIGLSKFDPYKITQNSYNNLFNDIIVVPNLWDLDDNNLSSYVIEMSERKIVIYDILSPLSELICEHNFTPEGLLAFRLQRHYNNIEFKNKVESELSLFLSKITFNNKEYFVSDELSKIVNCELTTETKQDILTKTAYYWKD